jgi:hypothetical protein
MNLEQPKAIVDTSHATTNVAINKYVVIGRLCDFDDVVKYIDAPTPQIAAQKFADLMHAEDSTREVFVDLVTLAPLNPAECLSFMVFDAKDCQED